MKSLTKTERHELMLSRAVAQTEQRPDQMLVSLAEFRRRRHRADLLKDPLARAVSMSQIRAKIISGSIELVSCGGNFFIDWNRYKDFIFRVYFTMPQPKPVMTYNQNTQAHE